MNLIQKSSVRKLVNSRECRISPDAFDGINRAVENLIDKMVTNVKNDGMKTLQTKHTGGVKTDENAETVYGRKCQRCAGVDDAFLRKAQDEQRWFYDEALKVGKAYSKGKKHNPHWATKHVRVNNFLIGDK